MSPRRSGSSGQDRGQGPDRRGSRRRTKSPLSASLRGGRGVGNDLQRTRLSHWRADGAAKTRFASEADANRHSLLVRLEHGNDVAAYPCEFCGGWHLGGSIAGR